MLLQVTWNASPILFELGPLAVRWYGLFWALSFYFGYEIMSRIFKREGLPQDQVDKLLIYMAVGSIVGARLGHCFFYDFNYYISNPLEILKIWQGGLASHGGAIGIIIALFYYQKKVSNKSYAWLLDRLVIPISLGAALIRFGNLMNSEIYGHQTDLPWGFIFARAGEIVPKHPTQFYEGIPYLLLFVLLGWLYLKKIKVLPPAFLLSLFAIIMFSVRFLVEFVKEDQSAFEADMMLNMGQWLSLPILIAGIVVMAWSLKQKPEPFVEKVKPTEPVKAKPKEHKKR